MNRQQVHRQGTGGRRRPMTIAIGLVLAVVAAGCSSGSASSSGGGATQNGATQNGGGAVAGQTVPTAGLPVPQKVGQGEGQLNLIAWEGYLDPKWVKPFEQQTGCQVNAKYAGSSDEMVSLMKNGGGGQYDMVSSSGDADLRILYAGDARPVNINLIPSWKDFYPAFQSPPFNTINGVHYGVSLQWGPNVLMYNTKDFPTAPPSWSVIYDQKYKGQVTVPDNPIQIADAALYLKTAKPSLGITDPYELTQPQFQAAVSLLAQQRPLIEKYWGWPPRRSSTSRTATRSSARVALPGQHAEGGQVHDRFRGAGRGGDRLGGHLDARGQGTPHELRLQVDAVHQHAAGPGAAGRHLR